MWKPMVFIEKVPNTRASLNIVYGHSLYINKTFSLLKIIKKFSTRKKKIVKQAYGYVSKLSCELAAAETSASHQLIMDINNVCEYQANIISKNFP